MTYQELLNVNLKLKTTDIKGKDYVEVNQRILAFRELYPEGCIETSIINLENGVVTMVARVSDANGKLLSTGTAQEKETSSFINKTSFIENCETSAVGRALGMLGIGIASSVASAEEVQNAILNQGNTDTTPKKKTSQKGSQNATEPYPTFEDSWTPKTQEEEIKQLCVECGKKYEDCLKWINDTYKVANPNGLPQAVFIEVVEKLKKAVKK